VQATLIESDPSAPALPNGILVPPVQLLDSILSRLVERVRSGMVAAGRAVAAVAAANAAAAAAAAAQPQ